MNLRIARKIVRKLFRHTILRPGSLTKTKIKKAFQKCGELHPQGTFCTITYSDAYQLELPTPLTEWSTYRLRQAARSFKIRHPKSLTREGLIAAIEAYDLKWRDIYEI